MNLEYYAIGNVTIHLNGPENFSTDHIRLFSWVTSFHFQSLEVVFPHMGVSLFISLTTKPINLTLISIIIAILFSSIFHHVNIHLSYTNYWFNTNFVRSQLFLHVTLSHPTSNETLKQHRESIIIHPSDSDSTNYMPPLPRPVLRSSFKRHSVHHYSATPLTVEFRPIPYVQHLNNWI